MCCPTLNTSWESFLPGFFLQSISLLVSPTSVPPSPSLPPLFPIAFRELRHNALAPR